MSKEKATRTNVRPRQLLHQIYTGDLKGWHGQVSMLSCAKTSLAPREGSRTSKANGTQTDHDSENLDDCFRCLVSTIGISCAQSNTMSVQSCVANFPATFGRVAFAATQHVCMDDCCFTEWCPLCHVRCGCICNCLFVQP